MSHLIDVHACRSFHVMLKPIVYFLEKPPKLTKLIHYFSGRWGDHQTVLKDESVLSEGILDQSALNTLENVEQVSHDLLLFDLIMRKLRVSIPALRLSALEPIEFYLV